MESVGDKIVIGNMTYRELLILGYAFGGADGKQALMYAGEIIAAMDRGEKPKADNGALRISREHEKDSDEKIK